MDKIKADLKNEWLYCFKKMMNLLINKIINYQYIIYYNFRQEVQLSKIM